MSQSDQHPPDGPALRFLPTRRAMRRHLVTPVVLTALGAAMLVGFVVAVSLATNHNDWLRSHGTETAGTVQSVTQNRGSGSSGVYTDGAVRVSFEASGHRWTESIALGEDARIYRPGQQVDVFYDPADPRDVTIDDAVNEAGWQVLVSILLLVVGFFVLAVGVVLWIRHHLYHHVLATEPWRRDDDGVSWIAGPKHRRTVTGFGDGSRLAFTKVARERTG